MMDMEEEPIPLVCPHCGQTKLFLAHVICRPVEGPMEFHMQLLEGIGHEYPTERPSGVTCMSCNFQCLACHKWAMLGITSGLNEGSWMRFEGPTRGKPP